MSNITRRDCIQGTLAALTVAGAQSALGSLPQQSRAPLRTKPAGKGGLIFTERMYPDERHKVALAVQSGLKYAILDVSRALNSVSRERYYETLDYIKCDLQQKGIGIAGIESHPVRTIKIRFGLPGRDEELENYVAAVKALGKVGIPLICWHFTAWPEGTKNWVRTRVDAPGRGGALTLEFDLAASQRLGLTEAGEISEDKVWANIEYFVKAVVPVAESANVKMALHPDDPPMPAVRGLSRVVISAKNYRRILDMAPSPNHGVTFCQANFKLMGEDIAALAREWIAQKKILYVHWRDLEGDTRYFKEVFHDEGPTDMAEMLRIYAEGDYDLPLRADHAPTMDGDSNEEPGYAFTGKVLAIGYMKGIMDALHLRYT
jgi:D-mannonate dehydratase